MDHRELQGGDKIVKERLNENFRVIEQKTSSDIGTVYGIFETTPG